MAVVGVVGAIIGLQILTTLGFTPNTSIIGVLVAIVVSRIPLRIFRQFRSIHRQNLVQTNISSATFGAANSLMVPLGVPVLVGRPDLVIPMLVGATMGMLIDLAMLYWLFDSRLFPGPAPWPLGIAAAEAILAGDEAGRRGTLLGAGAAVGVLGSSGLFGLLNPILGGSGIPMAALGIAFLGNVWALAMFSVGLLTRAYSPTLLGVNLDQMFVPHGIMIGAGLVALVQAVLFVVRRRRQQEDEGRNVQVDAPAEDHANRLTQTDRGARRGLFRGFGLYLIAALLLTALAGLLPQEDRLSQTPGTISRQGGCCAGWVATRISSVRAGSSRPSRQGWGS
jgi:uncharacterized oligopeptide transporter (OPT) family protein